MQIDKQLLFGYTKRLEECLVVELCDLSVSSTVKSQEKKGDTENY